MPLSQRLVILSILIVVVMGGGTVGFYVLERFAGGSATPLECLYQTIITLTTLGSREMSPLAGTWYGDLFVITLILSGMGVLFVFATTLTAFFVEGEVRDIFRRKKMDKALHNLADHIVVCGAGSTGGYVIEELLGSGHKVVIVEIDEERVQKIQERHAKTFIPYVIGSAVEDETLIHAGLDRAMGIVSALPDERDNLFVTVTARQMNPDVKIVARAPDSQAELRLKRAGADSVVSPNRIGGMRMASEMVRPQAVAFLDNMLRGQERQLRIEEIPLNKASSMVGKALRDTNLRQEADLLVLAIRDAKGQHFMYNPPPEYVLEVDSTLIVLGPVESVHRIREQMV